VILYGRLYRADQNARGAAEERDVMKGVAQAVADMAAAGQGILSADESIPTMNARLEKAGVRPTEANRRAYREMLVTTPDLARGVSGVVLLDETFRQCLSDGRTFPQAMRDNGLSPGIRVDTGTTPLAGTPGETVTEGLDGLRERLAEYQALGAGFARWRAVLKIGDGQPSWRALHANAHALARYASLCQETGLVPIIEPRVLMNGAHTIKRCRDATSAVLFATFAELRDFGAELTSVVLTPNMIGPAAGSRQHMTPEQVASETVGALHGIVPDEIAGIALLSGGQPPGQATANLAAIARLRTPWPATFCFGRALADPALEAWHGDPVRVSSGQRVLANRVACNVAAVKGGYSSALDRTYVLA
jgi:fructose-bisphosphate aldolase class I